MKTTTVAGKFITGVICRHGTPERVISDRGTQFTSDMFKEMNEMLGIKQSFTASYSPQADGQAEKAIGTLHSTLAKVVNDNQKDWDLFIPYALWAYRTAQHATTGETPFFLIYGRDPIGPAENRVTQYLVEHTDLEEHSELVANRLLAARKRVLLNTKRMKKRNMERFNKGKIDNPFKKGDVVWHKLDRAKASENRKLSPKFDGPWKIQELITGTHNLNVDLVHINNPNLTRRTSIRKLKKAFLRPQVEPYKEELVIPAQPNTVDENMEKEDSIPIQQIKRGPVINRKGYYPQETKRKSKATQYN